MKKNTNFVLLTLILSLFTACQTTEDSITNEMVYVEGGNFMMGADESFADQNIDSEVPVHQVTLSDYHISKYPVTIAQFAQFIKESGYITDAEAGTYYNSDTIETPGIKYGSFVSKQDGRDYFDPKANWRCDNFGTIRDSSLWNHPVLHVSWNDATAYCKWLSAKEKKNFRLPTDAEWEYAARGGQKTMHYLYSGSNNLDEVGWYLDNSMGTTHPVGQKEPNELGIYDLSGLVWEWCFDYIQQYPSDPQVNPMVSDKTVRRLRIMRGGSITRFASECRTTVRKGLSPFNRGGGLGFRIVCTDYSK